eukprot:scaffold26215_cov107-Isochrysis_galbana.AAC.5
MPVGVSVCGRPLSFVFGLRRRRQPPQPIIPLSPRISAAYVRHLGEATHQSRLLDEGMSCQEAYNAIEAARSEGLSIGTAAQERTDLADRIHKESLNLALSPLKTQPEGTRRVLIIEGVGICSKYMSDRLQSREVSDIEKQFELPAQDQMAVTRAWDGMASECISLDSGTRPDRVDACKRALCSGQLHAVILADASFTDLALRVLEEQLGPHLLSFVLAGGALAVTSSDSSQVLGALRRLFGVGWQKGGYYRTT